MHIDFIFLHYDDKERHQVHPQAKDCMYNPSIWRMSKGSKCIHKQRTACTTRPFGGCQIWAPAQAAMQAHKKLWGSWPRRVLIRQEVSLGATSPLRRTLSAIIRARLLQVRRHRCWRKRSVRLVECMLLDVSTLCFAHAVRFSHHHLGLHGPAWDLARPPW